MKLILLASFSITFVVQRFGSNRPCSNEIIAVEMKLGNTPARFMSYLCILKEISDGVETCREGQAAGRAGFGVSTHSVQGSLIIAFITLRTKTLWSMISRQKFMVGRSTLYLQFYNLYILQFWLFSITLSFTNVIFLIGKWFINIINHTQ